MNQENWYESGGWYAPAERPAEQPAAQPIPEKKKRRWPWAVGGVLLGLALIIALSVALRGSGSAEPKLPELPEFRLPHAADRGEADTEGEKKGKTPSYRDYLDSLYETGSVTAVKVNIPRAAESSGFRLTLAEDTPEELSLQALYENCYPSVVGISGYVSGKFGYSWGSGVILSEDGLIITNTHVIDGCDRAVVTLSDDTEYEAELIGFDSISDIALLKIDAAGLPAAVFGDSSALSVGQEVAAIGNPLGEQFRLTLSNGIVSAISRDINYKGRSMTLLQTNAALNEGNSGGPLFNLSGQVIGITNMKMMSSESSIEGIGFAIPTSTVESVVNAILDQGKVTGRVSIGISVGPIPDSARTDYDLPEGLYIVSVEKGTDAARKGLKAGDILMAVNGEAITETARLAEIKDQFQVGDELEFQIWRDGEILTVFVALLDTNDVYG